MSVPNLTTYVADNQQFKIAINSANPENGAITSTYEAVTTPQGTLIDQNSTGNYSWVSNQKGQAGGAPFNIQIRGFSRPTNFSYCIVDLWNGAYQTDNSMLLEGTRTYVNNQGVVQVTSLGTLRFTS